MPDSDLFIGLDLGGTKISTALTDAGGQIVARDYRKTRAAKGKDKVIESMLDAVYRVLGEASVTLDRVRAVGIGAPGPLDAQAGVVIQPPNLPGWDRVPLKQIFEDSLHIQTFLENDANAAAVGEHHLGAGQGVQHMIYVTVSTGIGGGFILDGKLYTGATGAAGEIGHMTVLPRGPHCGCGNRGCLEALSSGTAIAREARERVLRGVPTLIAELAHGDPDEVNAVVVAQAAEQGDLEAQEILSEAMTYLGIGMASLVNLLNPELIVIGGGLTKLGDSLFDPVRRTIDRKAFRVAAQAVRVVPAALGDDVGVLGAAAVAMLRATGSSLG